MSISRGLVIGGERVAAKSGRTTEDRDPYTGELVATVAAAGPDDVDAAVTAAANAFDEWAGRPPSQRRRILLKAADLLESRAADAVEIMAGETGATGGWAMFNVGLAAEILREAAAAATAPQGEVLAADAPGASGFAVRQPAGVVAAFAPWNAPIILGTRAVAVPLAVGNTVVLKPSEDAPLASGLFLADVLADAGLPAGVLNVITNAPADAAEVGGSLIADSRVRRVNFTGSTSVGRIIGEQAARHLKPAVLELGGKNALIVLDDADLEYAVNAVSFAAYLNSGQICMSADRILVHRAIAEEFTERLAAKAARLTAGDPRSPETVLGPLIDAKSAKRVAGLVDSAVAAGAKLRVGGGEPQGAVYPATVVSDVDSTMAIYTEETFGPVCTVTAFDHVDEAVRLANDSAYGLSAGVITEDLGRGLAIAYRLRTGIVHVNDQSVDDEPQAPFGGVKDSGYGRFGGRAGIESFTELRWITLQHQHKHFPF